MPPARNLSAALKQAQLPKAAVLTGLTKSFRLKFSPENCQRSICSHVGGGRVQSDLGASDLQPRAHPLLSRSCASYLRLNRDRSKTLQMSDCQVLIHRKIISPEEALLFECEWELCTEQDEMNVSQ